MSKRKKNISDINLSVASQCLENINPVISPEDMVIDRTDVSLTDNQNILHIIYGSRTGNSKAAAELTLDYARYLGIRSELISMQDFKVENFGFIKNLLIAVSTHGEGDPPVAAENLLTYLQKNGFGEMNDAKFSVLALGDSSYKHFCKTGHDFQEKLVEFGAEKVYDLMECDIDFEENAIKWIEGAVGVFANLLPIQKDGGKKNFAFEINRPIESSGDVYMAKVIEKRFLSEGKNNKNMMHISLSLKNSGIEYQPGDSIGVQSFNSRWLVDKLIKRLKFDPTHVLKVKGKNKMLKEALITDYELTLLTPVVIKKYAEVTDNHDLKDLINENELLEQYCETRDVVDLVTDFPASISIEDFLSVLRKLPGRLYSIASSRKKYPDQVHLTVGKIEYMHNNRMHEGVCTGFLSDRIEVGENLGIYLEENDKFRLPDDQSPIVMIGTGTGLAPFRAFLQEREANGATGKNWLIFGERNEKKDFLYREELEGYERSGLLTKFDTAFSRDQAEKIYVTHRMKENSRELFEWIKSGASIYLCGNKRTLAKSVRETLIGIVQKEGGMTKKEAIEYFENLKSQKRIQEDVY